MNHDEIEVLHHKTRIAMIEVAIQELHQTKCTKNSDEITPQMKKNMEHILSALYFLQVKLGQTPIEDVKEHLKFCLLKIEALKNRRDTSDIVRGT